MWSIFSVRPSPKKNEKIGGSEPFAHAVKVVTVFCLFLFGKECSADRLLELRLKLLVPSNRNSPYRESSQMCPQRMCGSRCWDHLLTPRFLLGLILKLYSDTVSFQSASSVACSVR